MGLQQWLGGTAVSQFVSDYFHKLPYSGSCADCGDCQLGQWQMFEKVVSSDDADFMIVRGGRRLDGNVAPNVEGPRELVAQGYTILVRHAERHDQQLARLAEDFRESFNAPVNIHIYATPAGDFGFDWHYDAEDVFILQTAGQKEYSLRKNTVNPWPLVENMPSDLKYERELMPLMRCLLKAGDWLYIPNGYWHKADAVGADVAISLAVGVMSHSALAIWDLLRTQLTDSLLWRQRLPTTGNAGDSEENNRDALTALLRALGEDVRGRLEDPATVESLIARLKEL